MEKIETRAITNTANTPKVCDRYVDELNSIDPHIFFPIEHETDGHIAFFDIMISRNSGTIKTYTH